MSVRPTLCLGFTVCQPRCSALNSYFLSPHGPPVTICHFLRREVHLEIKKRGSSPPGNILIRCQVWLLCRRPLRWNGFLSGNRVGKWQLRHSLNEVTWWWWWWPKVPQLVCLPKSFLFFFSPLSLCSIQSIYNKFHQRGFLTYLVWYKNWCVLLVRKGKKRDLNSHCLLITQFCWSKPDVRTEWC